MYLLRVVMWRTYNFSCNFDKNPSKDLLNYPDLIDVVVPLYSSCQITRILQREAHLAWSVALNENDLNTQQARHYSDKQAALVKQHFWPVIIGW